MLDPSAVLQDLRSLQQLQPLLAAQCDDKQEATVDLRWEALATITDRMTSQIVPADGLGAQSLSLAELALRAKRLIVLSELVALRPLVDAIYRNETRSLPCWEPFAGIEDLTIYTHHELRRITMGWFTCLDPAAEGRAALRDAHAEMRTLGRTSELAGFLRRATIARRSGFQATCARILETLILSIDVDLDVPLVTTARRPDTTGGVHGRGR